MSNYNLPKISIISPSMNCVHLIENCIQSVLSQNYPNIEHIIVDGASTDGTVEILKKYSHIKWVSEKDSGEAEALNKALRMVTGDIVNWLNVDDQYLGSDVFYRIVETFKKNPDCDKVYGKGLAVNEEREVLWYRRSLNPFTLAKVMRWFDNPNLFQPAMFYSRKLVDTLGPFREDLKYGIDYDYWLRTAANGFKAYFIDDVLAYATLVRKGAKSQGSWEEQHLVWQQIVRPFQSFLPRTERIDYWKDFYLFRITPPVPYTTAFPLPEKEEEIYGLIYAALERNHIDYVSFGIEALSKIDNQSADVYWLYSEALNKLGRNEEAAKVSKHAEKIALASKASIQQSSLA